MGASGWAWVGVAVVAVIAVLAGPRLWPCEEQQQRRKVGEGLVCRHEPYEPEKRKVGYAGKGAEACLRHLGCTEFVLSTDAQRDEWDILWTFHYQRSLPCEATNQTVASSSSLPRPSSWRRRRRFVNHCYHDAINNIGGRKSAQYLLFDGMRAAYGHELFHDYMPQTWLVPRDTRRILGLLPQPKEATASVSNTATNTTTNTTAASNLNVIFVYKPDLGARAKGIRFITPHDDGAKVAAILAKSGVVQRYIANPFLLHGYKHHLRLYLVTTSISPAHAFLFSNGLYLPASKPFTFDTNSMDPAVHLTNAAVSTSACTRTKRSSTPQHEHTKASGSDGSASGDGHSARDGFAPHCAHSLHEYWRQLEESEGLQTVESVQAEVQRILRRVVVSSFTIRSRRSPPCGLSCFEIHGVDIMLVWTSDSARPLKPLLLEVNHGPELYTPQSPTNDHVHTHLLRSTRPLLFPGDSSMASAWRVLRSCAPRGDLGSCAGVNGYKSCGEEAVWDLLYYCSQQMHAGFEDMMLACPPSTMERPFVQWASRHARALCCCQRHRRGDVAQVREE